MNIADAISSLQKQLDDLTSQFHGFSSPATASTLTHPNDPALASSFTHASTLPSSTTAKATTTKPPSSLRTSAAATSSSTLPAAAAAIASPSGTPKTVRFKDNPAAAATDDDLDLEAQRRTPAAHAALFNRPYRDDPAQEDSPAAAASGDLNNVQLQAYHGRVLAEQDAHLDELGASIGRQRELSMRIGDELDDHVALLEEADRAAERHAGALDRARRHVDRLLRTAGESKQMVAIVVLIVVLVLLIAILN